MSNPALPYSFDYLAELADALDRANKTRDTTASPNLYSLAKLVKFHGNYIFG